MKNKRSCRFAGYLLFIATVMGLFSCHSDQQKPGETTKDRTSTAESGTSTLPTNPDIPDSDNRLPNGIVLPEEWPPNNVKAETGGSSGQIPYLISAANGGTRPEVINISTGRQLFVDDFLIESTTLKFTPHKAIPHTDSPIMLPDVASDGKACLLSGGGVWYDEKEELFKMWYLANWSNGVAYAVSQDGIHWEKPAVKAGSNIVYNQLQPDSVTVWLNQDAEDPWQKHGSK